MSTDQDPLIGLLAPVDLSNYVVDLLWSRGCVLDFELDGDRTLLPEQRRISCQSSMPICAPGKSSKCAPQSGSVALSTLFRSRSGKIIATAPSSLNRLVGSNQRSQKLFDPPLAKIFAAS